MAMTAGVHLPQAGPAASGDALRRTAVLAEELGFADVWVSDHLAVPTGSDYPPSAYVFEPLTTMSWIAARATRKKGALAVAWGAPRRSAYAEEWRGRR